MKNNGNNHIPTSMKLMSPSIEAVLGRPEKPISLEMDTKTKSRLNIDRSYVSMQYKHATIRLYDHKASVMMAGHLRFFGHYQLNKLLACLNVNTNNPFTEFFTKKK